MLLIKVTIVWHNPASPSLSNTTSIPHSILCFVQILSSSKTRTVYQENFYSVFRRLSCSNSLLLVNEIQWTSQMANRWMLKVSPWVCCRMHNMHCIPLAVHTLVHSVNTTQTHLRYLQNKRRAPSESVRPVGKRLENNRLRSLREFRAIERDGQMKRKNCCCWRILLKRKNFCFYKLLFWWWKIVKNNQIQMSSGTNQLKGL